jgi:hypothetical protein
MGAVKSRAQSAENPDDPIAIWEADRTHVFSAAEVDLDALVWVARPLVIFADSPNDPQFHRQMELLAQWPEDLAERDVMIIVDTDTANRSAIRDRLRPRAFMMVLIDKDGRVALRKPAPWDVREISRSIDKTTLRQQEVRERREAGQ